MENITILDVLVEDGVSAQYLAGVVRGCVGQQLQPVLAALLCGRRHVNSLNYGLSMGLYENFHIAFSGHCEDSRSLIDSSIDQSPPRLTWTGAAHMAVSVQPSARLSLYAALYSHWPWLPHITGSPLPVVSY